MVNRRWQSRAGSWNERLSLEGRPDWSRLWVLMIGVVLWVWGSGVGRAAMAVEEFESNGTPASATPLDLSSGFAVGTGRIEPVGDQDYFSFTAPAGARVWIFVDTGGTPSSEGNSNDSYLTLLEGNGTTVIEVDDDDGSGNGCDGSEESDLASAIGGRLLTAGGTYFLRVNQFADSDVIDPYKVFVVLSTGGPILEAEPNGSVMMANPLVTSSAPIGVVEGAIDLVGDEDLYTVELEEGETIYINADTDPERDYVGTDVVVEFLSTDGSTVWYSADSSDDAAEGAEAFCYTVSAAGRYYVRVKHAAGEMGSYHLMAGKRPPGNLQFESAVFVGMESGGEATISVIRRGGNLGSVSVDYETRDGTATASTDYIGVSGTLVFAEGVRSNGFTILVLGDLLTEANERVELSLSMPTGGATLGESRTALLVILDDDEVGDDTPGTARPLDLSSGFVVVADVGGLGPPSISPPGDEDWYAFAAPPGAKVWLEVDTGGGVAPGWSSRDSRVSLFGADGVTVIEEDDDDGTENGCDLGTDSEGRLAPAIAGRTLVEGGTYYVRVEAFETNQVIDPYRLLMVVTRDSAWSEAEPNGLPEVAEPIVTAERRVGYWFGQIGSPGEEDYYSVEVPERSVLFVSTDCDPYRAGKSTDLVVELVGVDGSTILLSADSSGGEAGAAESFCSCELEAGIYFVRVKHFIDVGEGLSGTEVGPYGLMVARSVVEMEPNGSAALAVELDMRSGYAAVTGAIVPEGDEDYYLFDAPAGVRLWAMVDTGGEQEGGADSRNSVLTLLGTDGASVIEEDLSDGSGNGGDGTLESGEASVLAGVSLSEGGLHYLRVRGASGSGVISPYRLTVVISLESGAGEMEPNGGSLQAEPLIAAGELVEDRLGMIEWVGDEDYYSVELFGGNSVYLSVDGDPERDGVVTDVVLELLDRDGMGLLFSANSAAEGGVGDPGGEGFWYQVGEAGIYYLRVRHANGGAGSYRVLAARDRAELVVRSVRMEGGDVRLGVSTMVGRRYGVERSERGGGAMNWMLLPGTILGTGKVEEYLDLGGGHGGQAYYRVKQVP